MMSNGLVAAKLPSRYGVVANTNGFNETADASPVCYHGPSRSSKAFENPCKSIQETRYENRPSSTDTIP